MDGVTAAFKNEVQLMVYRKKNRALLHPLTFLSGDTDRPIPCTSSGNRTSCGEFVLSGSDASNLHSISDSAIHVSGNWTE